MATTESIETENLEERQAWLKVIAPYGTRIVGLADSAAQASPSGKGCWWEDWQDRGGIRLVVTSSATDDHLTNLAKYWGRPPEELIAFRNAKL